MTNSLYANSVTEIPGLVGEIKAYSSFVHNLIRCSIQISKRPYELKAPSSRS